MTVSLRLLLAASLLLSASVFSRATLAASELNGIAVYTELGAEQFMAGLYCDTPTTDPRAILLDAGNKRMEVRVLGETLLSNRFKRMWVEGVAINASPAELQQQAQHLADFSNMLSVKLQRDDNLSISVEGNTVLIQLNHVELGKIADRKFFDILLRTWIGPVPLSSTFRDSLLTAGNINDKQLSTYNKVDATPQRIAAIKVALIANGKNKNKKEPEPPKTQEAPPAEKTQLTKAEEKAAKEAALLAAKEKLAKENAGATPADMTKNTPPTETVSEPAKEPAPKASPNIAEAAPVAAPASAVPQVAAASAPAAKVTSPAAIFEDEDKQETADSLLAQQLYISKLSKRTAGFVKYPAEALNKNQTGSVRVVVTINRSGAITNVNTAAASEHAILNQAAMDAARSAAPYPPIPSDIKSDSFSFTVPVAFRIKAK